MATKAFMICSCNYDIPSETHKTHGFFFNEDKAIQVMKDILSKHTPRKVSDLLLPNPSKCKYYKRIEYTRHLGGHKCSYYIKPITISEEVLNSKP